MDRLEGISYELYSAQASAVSESSVDGPDLDGDGVGDQPEYTADGEALRRPRSRSSALDPDVWKAIYQEAAVYLLEGYHNDKLDAHPSQPDELRAYHFAHSTLFHFLDLTAGFLLMLLALLEEPNASSTQIPLRAASAVELCLLLVLVLNIYLRARWVKWRRLHKHGRIIVRMVLVVLMVADSLAVLVMNATHIRIIRALRPFFVLDSYYFKGVRRAARQIFMAIPPVLYMVVLILFVMVLFAAFASFVVSDGDDDPYLNSFANCFYSLFILMTTANFPDVMMPSYHRYGASAIFFVLYVFIMVFILLNLLLAVVFSSFQKLEKEKFRKLLLHKRKTVMLMYDLVTRATGQVGINFEQFVGIMKYYQPRLAKSDVRCMFLHLSQGSMEPLTRPQCYGVYEAANLKWTQLDSTLNKVAWYRDFPPRLFRVFRVLDSIVRSNRFSLASYLILMATFIIMLYTATTDIMHMVEFSVFIYVLVALAGVECIFKILVVGPIAFIQLFWNVWDMLLLILAIAGLASQLTGLQIMIFMRSFRLLQLFQLRQRYRDVLTTVVSLVPQLGNVVMVIILLYYFFAIIGMEVFQGKVFPGCCQQPELLVGLYYANGSLNNETSFYYLNNFDSLASSYVTLFELMVINNWWVTMNGFVAETSEWVRIFFFIYYFLSLMVLNILVAFVLDAFTFHLAVSPERDRQEDVTSSGRGSKYYQTVKVKVAYNQMSLELSQSTIYTVPAQGYLLYQGRRRLTREDLNVQMHKADVQEWMAAVEEEFQRIVIDLGSPDHGSAAQAFASPRRSEGPTWMGADFRRNLLSVRRYVEAVVQRPDSGGSDASAYLVVNLDDEEGNPSSQRGINDGGSGNTAGGRMACDDDNDD